MLFYLPNPSLTPKPFQCVIDTATGIHYNYYSTSQLIHIWSIHGHPDTFSVIDGASAIPFWQALVARATPITNPGEATPQ